MDLMKKIRRRYELKIQNNFILISIIIFSIILFLLLVFTPKGVISNIFYILLGSVLTLAGSFLAMKYKNYEDQLKEEQATWYEIFYILQGIPKFREGITGSLDKMYALGKDLKTGSMSGVKEKTSNDTGRSVGQELTLLALKIRSKRYYALARKVFKFVADKKQQTNEELESIKGQVLEAANEGFIKYYNMLDKKNDNSSNW